MEAVFKNTYEITKHLPIKSRKHSFPFKKTNVYIENKDCIDSYISLKTRFPNQRIGLLNLANAYSPGGGVIVGCKAQEEDICRRTNLYHSLVVLEYPIKNDEIICSENVYVVKDVNYNTLNTPFIIDCVLTKAAINSPVLINRMYNDTDRADMKARIELILNTATKYNLDSIVLGAFGCGAFKNPAHEVAVLFKEVISKYTNFDNIVFAILSKNGELNKIFKNVFYN